MINKITSRKQLEVEDSRLESEGCYFILAGWFILKILFHGQIIIDVERNQCYTHWYLKRIDSMTDRATCKIRTWPISVPKFHSDKNSTAPKYFPVRLENAYRRINCPLERNFLFVGRSTHPSTDKRFPAERSNVFRQLFDHKVREN